MNLARSTSALLGLIIVCAGIPTDARAAFNATAHLTLQSQPGDFIGQGQNFDVTYTKLRYGANSAQVGGAQSGDQVANLTFVLDQVGSPTNVFSILNFSTEELGIPLAPGTYVDAQRAGFADPGHPGLDVSFQNRGSNTVTGSFTIHSLTFFNDPTNLNAFSVASFSASFEQHSEGATPALFGTFTYQNLAAPAAVPEPASLALVGIGLLTFAGSTGAARKYSRNRSQAV